MYNNDGILIKGNKDGINTTINMNKFACFDDMLVLLIKKLSKGKHFYKGTTLILRIDLKLVNKKEVGILKEKLLTQIELKDIVLEDIEKEIEQVNEKEVKVFSGVYEGKTKFIRKTVRSGECINYQGNIVIVGDINSGAEVYAAGNVIVLGRIRGKVSAGTNGNIKAVIAAFLLQPELLKIANVIAMSPDDIEKPSYPELARIRDGLIIVEPYLPNKYIY
ncbi:MULTISPECIES: septum site-determining protein MinC [Clostridium]|jgi:septum site-determining protein MinC|uniref:Probable septum site-determining protein MinC n=4 Tax=Clostridium TaxID=1485 RepID=A0A0B5QKH4_CLOBE|nr:MULTISPECIES: septum site-determining protein MinC [Clostridium]ABR32684.1 septum site-determining protein MinC [Clostridium beijerinckii NCIMB 8052]AIU00320.1 septum formation inhibitor [Clostridium beijerinckii ATCC 35702]AJG97203.1 septation inhibitor protein [Clostridium beijerinckii]ALB48154.1 septum site-determining protein MinC [Clostridium beijerinckii NRRL B-598]AQS03124.1 septum site-determining protein MinC [Clostridium beijerinckii]